MKWLAWVYGEKAKGVGRGVFVAVFGSLGGCFLGAGLAARTLGNVPSVLVFSGFLTARLRTKLAGGGLHFFFLARTPLGGGRKFAPVTTDFPVLLSRSRRALLAMRPPFRAAVSFSGIPVASTLSAN